MAQLTATVVVEKVEYAERIGYQNTCTIAFGDGTNTYGTGIAITGTALGLPANVITNVLVGTSTTGRTAFYDPSSGNLRVFIGGTELASNATPAAQTFRVLAKGY